MAIIRKEFKLDVEAEPVRDFLRRRVELGCRYSAIQSFAVNPEMPDRVVFKLLEDYIEEYTKNEGRIQEILMMYAPADCEEIVHYEIDFDNEKIYLCCRYEEDVTDGN